MTRVSAGSVAEAIEIVEWYAKHGDGPARDGNKVGGNATRIGEELWTAGMNCTRGSAAEAVEKWLWAKIVSPERLADVLRVMVADPSPAVRACIARALLPLLNVDRERATALFLELSEGVGDELLDAPPVFDFCRYAIWTHREQLAPLVERMISSGLEGVVTKGARLRAFTGLAFDETGDLLDWCLSGPELVRRGAAEVLAAVLSNTQYRERCMAGLRQLFSDESDRVREAAAEWIRHLDEGEPLEKYDDLIRAYVDSPAFAHEQYLLTTRLQRSLGRLPQTTLLVARRFIEQFGPQAGSVAQRGAMEARELSSLILRLYAEAKDEETRRQCLDVLDQYTDAATYGLEEVLAKVDFDAQQN
jgi:hypothetical protein